ncbi:hypothetical protein OC845_001899 [Tilletia horrida]|nr:hypothetical protein OC845_001899 [Tilletia horrida]
MSVSAGSRPDKAMRTTPAIKPASKVAGKQKAAAPASSPPSSVTKQAPYLPYEILLIILSYASKAADSRPLTFLLLNKRISQDLHQHIYKRVTLPSYAALDNFSTLLLTNPHLRKHLRALWIGPKSLQSDLLRALAPDDVQAQHERQACRNVLQRTHHILRSCRNIQNLALSGKLLSIDPAQSYGKACTPKEVWSINPYAYLSSYLAPILEKTEIFRLFDLTLAQEECANIVKMPKLRHFMWTTPSSSSTSSFASAHPHMASSSSTASSSSHAVRYPPPREAALLWRILLLSNPHSHNRKTRPPLTATFAAAAELVSDVEASLCPFRRIRTTLQKDNGGKNGVASRSNGRKKGRRRAVTNGSRGSAYSAASNGDGASTHASLDHSSLESHAEEVEDSDDDEDEDDEEDDDDSDSDDGDDSYDRRADTSSLTNHHHGSAPLGPTSSSLSASTTSSVTPALTQAEALEASFRSLAFSGVMNGISDDIALPPALFLHQPAPGVNGNIPNGSSSGSSLGGSHSHASLPLQGGLEMSPEAVIATAPTNEVAGGANGVTSSDAPDPDAALNAISYEPPPPSRPLGRRAPSFTSLTSTHGHSSQNHARLGAQNGIWNPHQLGSSSSSSSSASTANGGATSVSAVYHPTLDDIDAPHRLRLEVVPRQMVLEWEALRDRVCPVNPPLSTSSFFSTAAAPTVTTSSGSLSGSNLLGAWDSISKNATVGAEPDLGSGHTNGSSLLEDDGIDPGNALWRIWRMWIEATET